MFPDKEKNVYQKFNSTVAWDVTNGSTPFLTPPEKKYTPAIEKNKLTIVSLKSADIESITEKNEKPVGAVLTPTKQ